MKDKKRKHPKSPEHIGKANKGPKKSDSTISGYLVTDTHSDITYTPAPSTAASTYASTYVNTWLGGSDLPPEPPIPSSTESAEQTASTPSKPIGKITSANIASISSWKPKDTFDKPLPPSNPQPASQDSESSEGTNKKQKKNPRKSDDMTFEPKLETIPLPLSVPLASKNEVAPSEEALLIPITPPTHVEHVHTSLPTLSQILDKEPQHQTHAPKHATLNDPISNPKSEPLSDIFTPPNTLFRLLQGQQTLILTVMKMETEIASLKEDNKKLQSFIHKEILSGLNQLAKIVTDKNQVTDQTIKSISKNQSQEFELIQKNTLVINNNIKNIGLGNQAIEEKIVSIEEKLASTTVEQKLDNLEKTIENLQLLKSDTPMDTTPMPQSTMPLPPVTFNSRPPPFSHTGQSMRPSYASIAGSKIQYQSTTWQNTPINKPTVTPAPFPKNMWTIRFPHKLDQKKGRQW